MIHPDFLDSPAAYQRAQLFWEALFIESFPRSCTSREVKLNYLNNPDNDGNPIFSAIHWPSQLGLRVIQWPEGESDDLDLDYWTDIAVTTTGEPEIRELVIACCPTEENIAEVQRLIGDWFRTGRVVSQEYEDTLPPWQRNTSYQPELSLLLQG